MNLFRGALLCGIFGLFCAMPAVAESPIASICDAVSGNLLLNCGFETGDFARLAGNFSGKGK